MDSSRKLELFKKAVSQLWARDGENTWPIEINSIIHLFMDLFVKELLEDMELLSGKGESSSQIAGRFKTSARVIRLIMPCLFGMKSLAMGIDERRQHVLKLLSLVEILKPGDLFNRDGKNIVLRDQEFKDAFEGKPISKADKPASFLIHRFCAILWNLAESICFKTHGLIREFHGPYFMPGDDREILIRDFYSLNPGELWPQCPPSGYSRIRVIAVYKKMDMSIDIYNNVAIKEGLKYVDNLDSYRVEGDGKVLNLDEVKKLSKVFASMMLDITTRVEKMDWKRLTSQYARIFWYAKKELRDGLGKEWLPPAEVEQRIARGAPDTRLQQLNPAGLQRLLRISF